VALDVLVVATGRRLAHPVALDIVVATG